MLSTSSLAERLVRLGFAEEDRRDAVRALADVQTDQRELAGVQAACERLVAQIGTLGPSGGVDVWPEVREATADADPTAFRAGLLAMLALVGTAPEVAAYHRSRGVPDDISTATLADLGRQVAVHRLTYGRFGLHTYGWEALVWSGALYQLGRLQLALQRDTRPGATGWVLGAHIPRSGPLSPESVDASFAAARTFFTEHFPEYPATDVVCESWLLDPALAAALPGSNLADFQRRWEPYGEPRPGDADVAFFVFSRRGPVELDELRTDTALRRAVVQRWRDGGHFSLVSGRLAEWPR